MSGSKKITLGLALALLGLGAFFASDVLAAAPFKHDRNTPIDITADTLEVFQEENKAVFSGRVVAIQGDVRLTSEKMTVHYREQGEGEGKGQNAIRKIEVEQNVFLTTPEETASGATGLYDVENNLIKLNNNVVLTRDKNTLKGEHLVYDFSTGKSTLTGGVSGEVAGQKGKDGRVRALFIPDKGEKKK